MMNFKDWIKEKENKVEEDTSTGDVANFSRPVGGMVKRMDQKPVAMDLKKKKCKGAREMEKDFKDL